MRRLRKLVWLSWVLVLIVVVASFISVGPAPKAWAQTYNFHVYLPSVVGGSAAPPPTPTPPPGTTPVYHYQTVNTYAHDPNAYTEGLFYQGGYFYEATGAEYQASWVRKEILTASQVQVVQSAGVPSQYYGEGIAPWGSSIYELTWTSHEYFMYDMGTFGQTGPFPFTPQTEGWGLTQDGTRFIMSDGTSTIYFRDPNTFGVTGQINVTDSSGPVTQLNELEYINGAIWANVWLTDKVAVISPQDGHVIEYIDFTGLRALQGSTVMNNPNAVLNGIAFDPSGGGHIYVTGKMWSHLYEIQVVP